jgi:2-dehydro-3-deoxy-D-gluconate 5-dehydrogenase
MTKALACAWAKDNVQVNAILPGWIDTPLTQAARKVILRKGDCARLT